MHDERIFRLLELGFSVGEIASVIGESETFVKYRKIVVMLQRQLIVKDINGARENKRGMAEIRRNKINGMTSFNQDIDTETIENHMEYVKAQLNLGKLEKDDAKAISGAILLDTDFITLSNVQVVVTYYTRNNEHKRATDFLGNCIEVLDDDDNRKVVLDMVRGTIDENVKRRQKNIEMVRMMQAEANSNEDLKQDVAIHKTPSGWEH